ncbi:MAG: glycosyltransferase, partial [Muribaculaceae bacterium]|nr:glycosyltransferase [Muribaculaceae bacterium]
RSIVGSEMCICDRGAAARLAGCKWVWVKKNMNWFGSSNKYWRLRTLFAHRVSVENNYFKEVFFKNVPKVLFNPISIDTDEFYPRQKDKNLLRELGLTENDKIILSLSNMNSRKSIETLIEAIRILRDKGICDFKCIIKGGGDPEYIQRMKDLANEYGLDSLVTFIGPSFDTFRYYSIADLFVITSVSEAGPATVLESMASGVVTLGTKVGGMLDRLAEFPEQLCEPGNPEELSEKINRFLHLTQDEKDMIVKREVDVVRKHFSLADEIKRHTHLYEELVK